MPVALDLSLARASREGDAACLDVIELRNAVLAPLDQRGLRPEVI